MFNSLLSKLLVKDTNGEYSWSTTLTVISFIVVNAKLIFSGFEIGHYFKMSDFSGVDYGAAIAAIAALHVGNKAVVQKATGATNDKS